MTKSCDKLSSDIPEFSKSKNSDSYNPYSNLNRMSAGPNNCLTLNKLLTPVRKSFRKKNKSFFALLKKKVRYNTEIIQFRPRILIRRGWTTTR